MNMTNKNSSNNNDIDEKYKHNLNMINKDEFNFEDN